MNFMETVAYLGAAVVCGIAVAAIFLAFWRGGGPDVPVLLYPMLRRQGDEVARLAIGSGSRSFALAVRQCVHCQCTARCRAWLDGGDREGFDQFCGNAGYVSRVRSLAALSRSPRWT